jgi:hypothetical protein
LDAIDRFIDLLREGPREKAGVFNPWRDHDERDAAPRAKSPAIRCDNMRAYLESRRHTARVLLLGEAPSHRGCRFTGIAFCSETELIHKRGLVAKETLPLTSAGGRDKPQRERSAHVIWGELERAGAAHGVVLWNSFPWHPHGAESVSTNRRPRTTEVEDGREPLAALLSCFSHDLSIFAVGKVAETGLLRWPQFHCAGYIRHPAQGGEAKFRDGFRQLVLPRL